MCVFFLVSLIGMNAAAMSTYIEFCADRLCLTLGHNKIYNAPQPFEWMESISLQGNQSIFQFLVFIIFLYAGKTDFFAKRVGEYQKSGVMAKLTAAADSQEFTIDADF